MTRPGQPDTRPRARVVSESVETGRGHQRHRHTTIRGDDGAAITITRYANRTAVVTVLDSGRRREYRESNAGSDRWLVAVVGYTLTGP